MNTPHTVLQFIKTQFIGSWRRSFDIDKAIYSAGEGAKEEIILVVCREGAGLMTYEFVLDFSNPLNRETLQVWIKWGENLIHIPAICKKSSDKDITKCR